MGFRLVSFYFGLWGMCQGHEVDLAWWLRRAERKIHSQNGEDGLIDALVDVVESSSGSAVPPSFVEFGVEDGSECNTRYLREGPRRFSGI